MSVIGPRPALWNQDVLTAERDKYGANDVKPGLTGWAQINGRDELEIPVKAKVLIVLTMRILLLYPKKMTLLNYLKMHIQFRNYIRCGMKRMKSDFREM